MDSKEQKTDPYTFPHEREELTLKVRPTANAWWKDPFKVYLLLEAFDNHCSPIDEACYVAGITRRQYKYFAQEHPIIYERRKAAKFIKRKRELIQKHVDLAHRVENGEARAAARFLAYNDPGTFDLRYRSGYARLRRIHGLPAHNPPPKSKEEQLEEMRQNVEKTRIMLGHPSDPKHYAVCPECAHLLNQEDKLNEAQNFI